MKELRVAVVGSGPAGCYAIEELRSHSNVVHVDLFDRLYAPFGLVRAGVAPDHQDTKLISNHFSETLRDPRVRLRLGVEIGRDVTLADLRATYDAVILAVGAPLPHPLAIPGSRSLGSHPVADFVGWYNEHPNHVDHEFNLKVRRAVIVGNGNVALDVARFLLSTPDELRWTDASDTALDALATSEIEEIVILGRRGPGQAAFSSAEFMGLIQRHEVAVEPFASEVDEGTRVLADVADTPESAFKLELMRTARPLSGVSKRAVFHFLSTPIEVVGNPVTGLRVAQTELVNDHGVIRAVASSTESLIGAGLVLHSVGFRGQPLDGAAFDVSTGTIPNEKGRALTSDGHFDRGLYVTGWIKRGPQGVIGTNRTCAAETVASILEDLALGTLPTPTAADNAPAGADLAAWTRINIAERNRGRAAGRVRVKLSHAEMHAEATVATRKAGDAKARP